MTLFSEFNIVISPNSVPTWSGKLPVVSINSAIDNLSVQLPIAVYNNNEYEYIQFDLNIISKTFDNEDSISLSGEFSNASSFSAVADPTVITGCTSVLDDEIESGGYDDGYNSIIAETFKEVLTYLLGYTGWNLEINNSDIAFMPVVTETSPVVVLNGTIIEQITQLIGLFTPSNLWGQSYTFFLNIFNNTVVVLSPQCEGSPHELLIDDIHPDDLSVKVEAVDKVKKIIYQEQESCLFRSDNHKDGYEHRSESYHYKTEKKIVEDDGDNINIVAETSGERTLVGNVTLVDSNRVQVSQSESSTVIYNKDYVGSDRPSISFNKSFLRSKSTDIKTTSEYSYVIGPPYNEDNINFLTSYKINGCYKKSLPGTRQQISRDYSTVAIDKNRYPPYLLTSDGIRVLVKKVRTEESTVTSVTSDSGEYYPVGDVNETANVITEIYEVFGYDEDGNLVTDHTETKVITNNGDYTVTNKTRILAESSHGLVAETTYTVTTSYTADNAIIESTTTGVAIQMMSGDQTGPSPVSAYESASSSNVLSETEIATGSGVGTVYTNFNNLVISEALELLTSFNLNPDRVFYVTIESVFLDVRGIIGGSIKLIDGVLNRSSIKNTDGSEISLATSELINYMEISNGFRVSGISMYWKDEDVPSISLAMCQLI